MINHEVIILATCAYGYIGKCSCCDKYNLVFNNQLFIFSEDDLRFFRRMLENDTTLFETGDICCNGRTIAMKTPMENFFLMFTPKEMDYFQNMLDESFIMIEVNKVLQY